MALDVALFNQSLPAKIAKVAFHARTVAAVGQPSEIVCGDYAEFAEVGECLDFRFLQGILVAATAIDRA